MPTTETVYVCSQLELCTTIHSISKNAASSQTNTQRHPDVPTANEWLHAWSTACKAVIMQQLGPRLCVRVVAASSAVLFC